jgi:hypothetical protein
LEDGHDRRVTPVLRARIDVVAAASVRLGDTYGGRRSLARRSAPTGFADRAGPCLQALATGEPVGVPDIAATMDWPGFHEVAPALGLRASISIPLYNGRGTTIAVLNLYGRDDAAMKPLIAAMAERYASSRELDLDAGGPPVSDPGAEELLAGYAGALSVRATIQLSLDVLAGSTPDRTDDAYTELCARAADNGTSLSVAAAGVLKRFL